MKVNKIFIYLLIAGSFFMLTACGGGGGGSAGTGELAIDVTDAKPLLPDEITNFYVTFSEVLAHSSGGGWESLPMPQTPYTIDLLQFYDGKTTELVPPVMLRSGKYTQIRLVLEEGGAWINFKDDPNDYPVLIPSENLKTDKNIDFDLPNGGSVDLMIDFDLSQSLVVTDDGSGTLSYKLKPVLHIVDTFEAATISGEIDNASFDEGYNARVTVFVTNQENPGVYEEYTKVEVLKSDTEDPTPFSIYWLVPNKDLDPSPHYYKVEIYVDSDSIFDYIEENIDLEEGEVYSLGTIPQP